VFPRSALGYLRRVPGPVILAFGLRPERLTDAEGRIDCFLEPPGAEKLDLLVQALRSGLDDGGAVIVLLPDWFDPDGAMRLDMATSVLDDVRVAVHRTSLPPLAGTALASLASSVAPHLPSAGMVASVLPDLEAQLQVVTWLGSVGGLTTPSPSMGMAMASWGPSSAFAVSSYPELAVHRVRKNRFDEVPLPPVERPSHLVVADHGGDAEWMHEAARAMGVDERAVEPTDAGRKWWGTGKLVEGVLVPTDVERLGRQLMTARDSWHCRWCGSEVGRSPCPMCGHRGGPPRRAQQGAVR
jgi:hypothetical protein